MPTAPFRTVSDFHGYWLKRLERAYKDAEAYEDLQQLQNSSVAHASTPVLSRASGGLAPRNILVKDDRIVVVVDCETFGWYPELWEMMAVRNELMSKRLLEAQRDVFGHITWGSEVDVYLRVCRCALY
ncbi:hypothetical protein PYCCODRAFT_331293 [Trametes coccinea BRFM310]|uniref:Aminoglycoside phosphotransferase domain-containing protein n=1 Tax=Trametes coccinea (strain BRFM310) TaxID=1353009 RepID=A0A1Y2IRU8_TRAC3|nr:hypothetical protein PYCCODRAFT_331293 [Trametes coccinea BRFM310]